MKGAAEEATLSINLKGNDAAANGATTRQAYILSGGRVCRRARQTHDASSTEVTTSDDQFADNRPEVAVHGVDGEDSTDSSSRGVVRLPGVTSYQCQSLPTSGSVDVGVDPTVEGQSRLLRTAAGRAAMEEILRRNPQSHGDPNAGGGDPRSNVGDETGNVTWRIRDDDIATARATSSSVREPFSPERAGERQGILDDPEALGRSIGMILQTLGHEYDDMIRRVQQEAPSPPEGASRFPSAGRSTHQILEPLVRSREASSKVIMKRRVAFKTSSSVIMSNQMHTCRVGLRGSAAACAACSGRVTQDHLRWQHACRRDVAVAKE